MRESVAHHPDMVPKEDLIGEDYHASNYTSTFLNINLRTSIISVIR